MLKSIGQSLRDLAYLVNYQKKVILSVPHAVCDQGGPCDKKAAFFAELISKNLKKRKIEVHLHVADIPRKKCDLNRPQSRGTQFRNKIDIDSSFLGPDNFLLDVHSAKTEHFRLDFEILFLDLDDLKFTFLLDDYLKKSHIRSYILGGSDLNDVTYKALYVYGIRNVTLIEINRELPDKRYPYIADRIAEFVANFKDPVDSD